MWQWLKDDPVTSYCPDWWWHMCPWQGIPAPLTDVARHTNDIQIAAEVQSFQKTTHFSTELHRKLLGKWLSPLFSSYCASKHCVKHFCLALSDRQLSPSLQPYHIVQRSTAVAFVQCFHPSALLRKLFLNNFLLSLLSIFVPLCFHVLPSCILHAFHASTLLGHELPRSCHTAQSGIVLWGHPVLSMVK